MTTGMPSWNNDPLALVAPAEPARDAAADQPAAADYEAFFRSSYADTVRHLVRRGLDAEAAADCAQEAYVRAYAHWWRIRRYDDPAGWVRRVATNLAIDLRRRNERATRALPELAANRPASAPAPTEPGGFEAMTAQLPEQQRRVVELCYGEDLSAEQAAGRLGITSGAVRFHLTKARARLRPGVTTAGTAEETR
jgi:RNA polymerase sigma-70 factor (ECF subfamily)